MRGALARLEVHQLCQVQRLRQDRARPASFAYADRLRAQGKLAIGRAFMDAQGRRIGLLFVYEAASRDEALIFAEQDPFTVANALSGYEIS